MAKLTFKVTIEGDNAMEELKFLANEMHLLVHKMKEEGTLTDEADVDADIEDSFI